MNSFFLQQLNSIVGEENIITDEEMKNHTTFKIGGPVDFFIRPVSEETLNKLIWYLSQTGREYFILGNGSNLLVSDHGYRGIVIDMSGLNGITVEGNKITAMAGAMLSKTAQTAAQNSLSGMEGLSGIPGTVGGAAVMNAGAYECEMADVVRSVRICTGGSESVLLSNREMKYGYRTSECKQRGFIVTAVEFELKSGNREEIEEKMQELALKRRKKQPLEYPSAGSAFKRPEGHFAGKLIMDAGLSGYTIGGAKISEKHCGFIVNTGRATAADVYDLINEVREKVYLRFGVKLEPEICMLGEF